MIINNDIAFVPINADIKLISRYNTFRKIIKKIHPNIFLKKNCIDFQKILNTLVFSKDKAAKVKTA